MTDNENFDRIDMIKYRLDQHILSDLRIAVSTPTLDEWAQIDPATHAAADNLHLGWIPPFEHRDPDGKVTYLVIYQPEVLSLLTDTLDDDDFIIFMDTLEWMIDKHIVHADLPVAERTRLIENELYDINPAVLAFLSAIELAAMS